MAQFKLRCKICEGKFLWNPLDGPPAACPICQQSLPVDERLDSAVVHPGVLSLKTKATDKVYRDIERGSEQRVQLAAEATQSSTADMAALAINNLRDNQREGDVAAMAAAAAEQRLAASTPAPVGFTGQAGYSDGISSGAISINGQVLTGIEPNAGARAIQRVQQRMLG